MKLGKQQWATIGVGVLLIVLLILAPRKVLDKDRDEQESAQKETKPVRNLQSLEDSLTNQIIPSWQEKLHDLKAKISATEGNEQAIWLDSLANTWTAIGNLELAAHYAELAAGAGDSLNYLFKAGDAYFNAYRYAEGVDKREMIDKAVYWYQEILYKDSMQLKAMTGLGVCLVEGSQYLGKAPMEGITMLKKVLEKDPNNVDALVNLGYFAIQSGQLEKAMERFSAVKKLDPTYAEANLYLADIYLSKEDTAQAIECLETYKELAKDSLLASRIEEYIGSLKRN